MSERASLLGKKDVAFLGVVALCCAAFIGVGWAAGSPPRFLVGLAVGGGVSIAGIAAVTALYRLRAGRDFLGASDERVSMIVQRAAAISCFTLFICALLAIVLGSAGLFGPAVDPVLAAGTALGVMALSFMIAYVAISRRA